MRRMQFLDTVYIWRTKRVGGGSQLRGLSIIDVTLLGSSFLTQIISMIDNNFKELKQVGLG